MNWIKILYSFKKSKQMLKFWKRHLERGNPSRIESIIEPIPENYYHSLRIIQYIRRFQNGVEDKHILKLSSSHNKSWIKWPEIIFQMMLAVLLHGKLKCKINLNQQTLMLPIEHLTLNYQNGYHGVPKVADHRYWEDKRSN